MGFHLHQSKNLGYDLFEGKSCEELQKVHLAISLLGFLT